ncbi:twin-arginine translocase TatA/TatE family subunit [Altererythrobacter sp. MF3-039]|uniref:twin-arginine translocase TatA/TatE family subunit n=1 Tax=Altererythrobacter sp. MF3-039 TaxID=3252901 RepID=UPI00390C9C85
MSLGPWQLIIIALVILVLFGRGRISEMMGDFGKGIKSFKQGMSEEEKSPGESPRIESSREDVQASGQSSASTETEPQPRTPPPDTRS